MAIEIKKVTNSSELKEFIKFPWQIYKDDKHWVPPLISEQIKHYDQTKNVFFRHAKAEYYMAFKDGKLSGTIAAIINHNHNSFWKETTGFFGAFECIDDQEVANALIDQAKAFTKAEGMNILRGPATFSTNDPCGLLVDGFDYEPQFMMGYNAQYYQKLIENYGFKKAKDLWSFIKTVDEPLPEKVAKIVEFVKKRYKFTIRSVDMKNLVTEINHYKRIYNLAWEKNWGFIPLEDYEIDEIAKDIKQVLDPDLLLFVEKDGVPIAFTMAVPNMNEGIKKCNGKLFPFGVFKLLWTMRKPKWVRLMTTGIIEEYRSHGVDALLYAGLVERGTKKSFKYCDISWQLEDNDLINRAIETMGGKLYKIHRFYDLSI